MTHIPHIAVAGLGLLGASICQTLKDHKFPVKITGVSSPSSLSKALKAELIDNAVNYDEIGHLKSEVDLFILCTPIEFIFDLIDKLAASEHPWKHNSIVTDVGSTKLEIVTFGQDQLGADRFVGGHPMAGSEKSGIEARDSTLFESALWLLCPSNKHLLPHDSLLVKLIENLGSRIHFMDAETHDQWLAQVSHLPQILSTTLSVQTYDSLQDAISVAGPGYRDMTRLSLSQFPMWDSIFKTNKSMIIQSIQSYQHKLENVKTSIQNENWSDIESIFEQSFEGRQQLNIPNKGWAQNLIEIIVQVQDQKGMISKIVVPLTDAGLDIRDIQLLKIREGSGGTLSLSFASLQDADQAVLVLKKLDIKSKIRGMI